MLVKLLIITGVVALSIGIGLVGSSSYVKNTIYHHSPLYPLVGEGKVDIMTSLQPKSYEHKSTIHKFIETNLNQTLERPTEEQDAKIPFSINPHEVNSMYTRNADTMHAGYGVWFGGILIITVILGIYLTIKCRKKFSAEKSALAFLPIVSLAITIVMFDNSWWARYLPHLYIVPVILLAALFALKYRTLPYIIAFLLFFNNALLGVVKFNAQLTYANETKVLIEKYAQPCDRNTKVYADDTHQGKYYNIWDACNLAQRLSYDEFSRLRKEQYTEIYGNLYIYRLAY